MWKNVVVPNVVDFWAFHNLNVCVLCICFFLGEFVCFPQWSNWFKLCHSAVIGDTEGCSFVRQTARAFVYPWPFAEASHASRGSDRKAHTARHTKAWDSCCRCGLCAFLFWSLSVFAPNSDNPAAKTHRFWCTFQNNSCAFFTCFGMGGCAARVVEQHRLSEVISMSFLVWHWSQAPLREGSSACQFLLCTEVL